jgi:hypothetical protein
VRLFLDTSVLLAASASASGASREIFLLAPANSTGLCHVSRVDPDTLTPIPATPLAQAEQDAVLTHIRDLLAAHFREAEESADEEGKFSIGFRATFDRSASPTKLKVACRISKTFTDEIEASVPDPNQPELL